MKFGCQIDCLGTQPIQYNIIINPTVKIEAIQNEASKILDRKARFIGRTIEIVRLIYVLTVVRPGYTFNCSFLMLIRLLIPTDDVSSHV